MRISSDERPAQFWLRSFLLLIPVFILYFAHYSVEKNEPGTLATGYIIGDMPYYMANALEYKEASHFQWCYPLPFSSNYENNPVYFHPQIFVMGMILRYCNIDTSVLFILFGFIFAILGIRICLKLLQKVSGADKNIFNLLSVLFLWGGGLLVLSGFIFSFVKSGDLPASLNFKKLFSLDPFEGWWFLNLGRNFIFPTEAYYHFLFFLSVYFIQQRKNLPAVYAALLLSVSHPFTGIAILLFVASWLYFEKIFMKNKSVTILQMVLITVGLCWFVFYNLIYLPTDPEHKMLMEQWTLDWAGGFQNYIPAYLLVAIPAFVRLSTKEKFRKFFADPFGRFLLIWLVINLLLENHNLFIRPHQPLHFTRGYVWACLFLIGCPVIVSWLKNLFAIGSPLKKYGIITVIISIVLLDNLTWMTIESFRQREGGSVNTKISEKEVLDYLSTHYLDHYLLISQNKNIGYLSTVYTPYRSFYSHKHNTPDGKNQLLKLNRLMNNCIIDSSMQSRNLVFVVYRNKANCEFIRGSDLLYENKDYEIYSRNAH